MLTRAWIGEKEERKKEEKKRKKPEQWSKKDWIGEQGGEMVGNVASGRENETISTLFSIGKKRWKRVKCGCKRKRAVAIGKG